MLDKLTHWLDDRTGYKALMHEALEEPIPGGARWKYAFGSALTTTFMMQFVTGILLMFSYSPSSTTAWGSVYYITHQMDLGWFIRGIHHFGSQAMVILLGCHLIQVLVAGAYRSPREFNWWFGMLLMFATLGLSLTGYLLPWDQKGYWATKVATNIAGGAPVIGPAMQKVVVGGSDYGNQTLTRFYGLHVGVLPAFLVMSLVAHIVLFRKHGITAPANAQGEEKFWPKQVFYDVVVSTLILGILTALVLYFHGADLDAPADPSSADYPARPEWYFLSLFQMLKLFPGESEMIGTIIIPGAIMTVLLLMPFFDKVLPRKLSHLLCVGFVLALVGGAGYLTFEAMQSDRKDPVFIKARARADEARERALLLAQKEGIPPEGAAYLLARDPLHHGGGLVEQKCLGCHRINDIKVEGEQSAPDLTGYGSKAWVRGLLEKPDSEKYFGKAPQCDGMQTWKESSKLNAKELDDVADYVASFATIPVDVTPEEWSEDPKVKEHPGRKSFQKECVDCHTVGDVSKKSAKTQPAPDLFAWGSDRWIDRMIRTPGHPQLYGYLESEQKMPAFGEQMTASDLKAIVRYLKGDYIK